MTTLGGGHVVLVRQASEERVEGLADALVVLLGLCRYSDMLGYTPAPSVLQSRLLRKPASLRQNRLPASGVALPL